MVEWKVSINIDYLCILTLRFFCFIRVWEDGRNVLQKQSTCVLCNSYSDVYIDILYQPVLLPKGRYEAKLLKMQARRDCDLKLAHFFPNTSDRSGIIEYMDEMTEQATG